MEKSFERREDTRFYLKNFLRRIDSDSDQNYALETINISAGGILFRSNLSMQEKEVIELQFAFPSEDEEKVVIACRIMHVLETIPGKQYFIGGGFEKTEGFDPKFLIDYFEEQKSK